MPSHRGRYDTAKVVGDYVPAWAHGCDQCKHGIVSAPELTGAASLYMERLVQAIDGDVHFCTCQAGTYYRSSLLNRRQVLIEEARKDKRMVEAAQHRTHPDIEATRRAMHEAYGKVERVPTIRYEGTVQPEMETA